MRYPMLLIILAACSGGSAATETAIPVQDPITPESPVVVVPTEDGFGNNEQTPEFGAADVAFLRLVPSEYTDGIEALAGATRPNPRAISNAVFRQEGSRPNATGASDMLWQWGQFLDHDITLTPESDPAEFAPILVPAGDVDFDPFGTSEVVIPFVRSAYVPGVSPRQQVNAITAFIDASNVYGSDDERALALRALDGTGRLKTSAGDLLPFNVDGIENAGGTGASLFVAGDVRANEQLGLTAMHVLFMREHNRLAGSIRATEPELSGEDVYQRARRLVAAQMQVITYREFLPLLLGRDAIPPYRGYDETVDPGITNLFATAAYRFGHSLLSPTVLRLDAAGNEIPEGHLSLRDAFFDPTRLIDEGGIDPVLRGLAAQRCEELDAKVVEDVRSFLFGAPGAGGIDLAAMNIQRGRDHGCAGYNEVRAALGLPALGAVPDSLASAYAGVDQIDVWVGGLAEPPLPGAMVGPLFHRILVDQFRRLRDGDRYWYQRRFAGVELDDLESTRLADIIRRNTGIGTELSNDVFRAAGAAIPPFPSPSQPIEPDRRHRIARHFGGPQ